MSYVSVKQTVIDRETCRMIGETIFLYHDAVSVDAAIIVYLMARPTGLHLSLHRN